MKKIVYLHPNVKNLNDMIEYLCLDDSFLNYVVWDEKNPEIVIASEHIYKDHKMMKTLKGFYQKNALLIYHAGEAAFPDLTIFDYAIAINTRLINLDRIVRIPPSIFYARSTIRDQSVNNVSLKTAYNVLNEKDAFCAFIYSNPVAHPMRDKLFFEISKYKRVDSLGGHLNNVHIKNTRHNKNWAVLSVEMKKPYKFTISSENALFDGYTSEKILTSFQAHSIPIYWGNPYIAEEFNQKAFINCHDFDNIDELIKYIKKIDEDDDLWKQMISEPWQTVEQINAVNFQMKLYKQFMYNLFTQDLNSLKRRPEGTFASMYSEWFFKKFKTKNKYRIAFKKFIKKILKK